MPGDPEKHEAPRSRTLLAVAAVGVIVVAAAIGGWLVGRDEGRGTAAPTTTRRIAAIGPVVLSAQALHAFARALGRPIYWAGPRAGDSYELTVNGRGYVYVRYLPAAAAAKRSGARYLVVATYPLKDAARAVEKAAHGKAVTLRDGTVVLPGPKSTYLARPHAASQVEVYAPDPARAKALALSGRVRAVR